MKRLAKHTITDLSFETAREEKHRRFALHMRSEYHRVWNAFDRSLYWLERRHREDHKKG